MRLVKGSILSGRRAARPGRGAHNTPGARPRCRFDHDAIGIDVGENDVDPRQGCHLTHVELCMDCVLPHRLMVVNDLAVRIRKAERSQIA